MSSDSSDGPRPPRVPAQRPGRTGGKRDANRRERIRQLCDAALPLLLSEGVTRVTIDQIVDAAGVAKGSFYRYFTDKEELVATIFQPLAEQLAAALDACERAVLATGSPAEVTAAYLELARAGAALVAEHPDALLLFLQESRGPAVDARRPIRAFADQLADRATELSDLARRHGLLRDSDPRIGSLIVLGATERLLFEHFTRGGFGDDPARVYTLLISIMLDGVRRR